MILHCAPAPGRSASRSGQLADRGKVEFYAFDILVSDGEDVRKLPRAPPAYQMRSKVEAPAFETVPLSRRPGPLWRHEGWGTRRRLNLRWTLTIVPGFTARHEIEGRRPSLRRPSEVTEPP